MEKKEYKRNWMRQWRRAHAKPKNLFGVGHCPKCGILLDPEYEKWHRTCPWYKSNIHTVIEVSEEEHYSYSIWTIPFP